MAAQQSLKALPAEAMPEAIPETIPEAIPEVTAEQIEDCFHAVFYTAYKTRLAGGASEPEYRAPCQHTEQSDSSLGDAVIVYRQDYSASVLHEVAHWCIAGQQRRQQNDYGYWYSPDGRDETAQRLFEKVEAKPQALEYLFSACCGLPFRLSVDNLALPEWDQSDFAVSVWQQFRSLPDAEGGARWMLFADALARQFQQTSWQHCWQFAQQQPAPCFDIALKRGNA